MIPDSARIDLWCTFPVAISDQALLQTYQNLLSDSERKQHQQFYFAKDRHRYLITRALTRTVLSRYTSIAADQLTFATNEFGKPRIINDLGLNQEIAFNITHADNLILIGVTRDCALGVDTENSQNRTISRELAEYSFAVQEVADFLAQPIEQQQQRFFEFWTLKESYIKARGMGLSIPLKQFSFRFPRENLIELDIDALQHDAPERWRFWQLRLAKDYLVAVCAEKINPTPPLLVLRHVVPLMWEEKLDYQLLRSFPST